MLHPVKSIKHVVDTNGAVFGAAASVNDIAIANDNPAYNTSPNQVNTGAQIFAFFLNVQVIQAVAAGGVDNIYMIIYKNNGNNLVNPPVDNVGASDLRRFVIHQEMVMTGTPSTVASAIPKTLFKGVIKIPKSLRRFGVQDRLQVVIGHRTGEVTQQTSFCLQCIYKEFGL